MTDKQPLIPRTHNEHDTCRHCIHADFVIRIAAGYARCRYNAPVLVSGPTGTTSGWPQVHETDYCRMFERVGFEPPEIPA